MALGAGATFRFHKLEERRLAQAFESLLSPETRERARAIGRALRDEDGAARNAEHVEEFAPTHGVTAPERLTSALA